MKMIELKEVSKWYGAVQVLNNCTTSIDKGEVVVVCGPSGSGKSTLIKTINALEPFQKGEIFVDGQAVHDPKTDLPKLRSHVGMVFQNFELFPHLSVTENLTLAQIKVLGRKPDEAKTHGLKIPRPRGPDGCTRTSFPASSRAASSSAWRLRARCAWTRSSCCSTSRPRRWTRKWSARCWTCMVGLANEGMTMMVVTHEMGFASKVGSRVIFMDVGGRILEDCSKDEFFSHPENRQPRTKDFLNKILPH